LQGVPRNTTSNPSKKLSRNMQIKKKTNKKKKLEDMDEYVWLIKILGHNKYMGLQIARCPVN